MLPNSAGAHEGNLRHSKSKSLLTCLSHSQRGNVHLKGEIAVQFSHERLESMREILPASIDGYVCKIEQLCACVGLERKKVVS